MDANIEASIADIEAYNQQNMDLNSRIPTVQAQESSHCDTFKSEENDEFDDSIVHRRSSVYE